MEIKMRVNTNTKSRCDQCSVGYRNVREMYDVQLFGETRTICYCCMDALFRKLLSARCKYNNKVKSPEDNKRLRRERGV